MEKIRRITSSQEKRTIVKAAAILWLLMLLVTTLPVAADNWGVKIPRADKRFEVLRDFDDEAVLDKETDLVWERSPETPLNQNFYAARDHCAHRAIGGRKGWKLPTFDQLATLVDPSEVDPALPPGHPFIGIWSEEYWTATFRFDEDFGEAWIVDFRDGRVNDESDSGLYSNLRTWCVRTPHTGPVSH